MSGQTITQSCSVLYRLLFLWVALKSSSNLVSANQQGPKLFGVSPDRFVASSPLVVGVSCSDGAVLVAVHAMFAEEPLLVDADEESRTLNDGTNTTNRRLLDLPRQYRGPFRIYSVDSFGSCLVSAGWRTDGQTLAKYCRHLARDEISLFGVPCQTADHGKYLASEASVWMARSALSERLRPLSCVGLLASCGESTSPGSIWLVDITGAYKVKAHAIGNEALASKVNDRLAALNLSSLETEEACQRLVDFFCEMEEIPTGSRLEVATVGSDDTDNRSMKRRLISSIKG